MKNKLKVTGIGLSISSIAMLIAAINMLICALNGISMVASSSILCGMTTIFLANLSIYSSQKKKDEGNSK